MLKSARGYFIDIHNWRGRTWISAVAEGGLDTAVPTPEALRHTAEIMPLVTGANVTVTQRMFGHADASMKLNTQTDLWPDRLVEVSVAVSLQRARALAWK